MTYSVRNIVIAVVLAVLAAVLVIMYTSNAQKQATKGQETVQVVVAKTTIPAGTTVKDAIAAGDFQTRSVVTTDAVVGALNSTASLALHPTYASTSQIVQGSQITSDMFAESNANPVVLQISGPDRAVQFSLNANMVLGGTLKAGDHVDIGWTGTLHPSNASSKYGDITISKVIFSNIEVLSTYDTGVGSTALTADGQPANGGGSTNGLSGVGVIVKLSQVQVAPFLLALQNGTTWMALRGKDATVTTPAVSNLCTLAGLGLTAGQLGHAVPSCIGGGK